MRRGLKFLFAMHGSANTKSDVSTFGPSSSSSSSVKSQLPRKRILCLHGRCQSGAILANKIAGARKKLQRTYELDFLDGPLLISETGGEANGKGEETKIPSQFAWWDRDESGKHVHFKQAFDYVVTATEGKNYDAIIGFSQGGLLGSALVLSGAFPSVKAIITAGSPCVDEVLWQWHNSAEMPRETSKVTAGMAIPKLHFAGETDAYISVESTRKLCEKAGNGSVIVHEKGHLFPTKAEYVNKMLDFLDQSLNRHVKAADAKEQCGSVTAQS